MKKSLKRFAALGLAAVMAMSVTGCGSPDSGSKAEGNTAADSAEAAGTAAGGEASGPVTIKITWWGGQGRHDYTQKLLDTYTASHPNVTFETMPSGWDGYFDLSLIHI